MIHKAKCTKWLAELEAGFTVGKARVEALKARLFARLRERWMASLRRAMRTTPQAHLLGMALRARGWHGATERRHPPRTRQAVVEGRPCSATSAVSDRTGA